MITVITAVYNGAESIAHCLSSVGSQRHADVEHLVLDGASTDGTVDVVQRLGGARVRLISEPDEGLYDALNKGVGLASHDIVGLLHADDELGGPDVLAHVAAQFESDPTLEGVYGDLVYVAADDTSRVIRYWQAGEYTPGMFLRGWMPPHPTLFLRRSAYQRIGPFRTDLRIAADYEFMLRAFHLGRLRVRYLPEVITRMRLGGASNASVRNILRKTSEDLRAWQLNGLSAYALPAVILKNVSKLPQFIRRPGT